MMIQKTSGIKKLEYVFQNSSTSKESLTTNELKNDHEVKNTIIKNDSKKKRRDWKGFRLTSRRKSASFSDFGVLQNKVQICECKQHVLDTAIQRIRSASETVVDGSRIVAVSAVSFLLTVKPVYSGHAIYTLVFNRHFSWNQTGKLRSSSYKKTSM